MNNVTREQFEIMNDLQVRHIPTGATVSTYEYLDPNNAASTVRVNPGRAGEILPSGEEYCPDEIRSIASILLREQAG